MATLTVYPDAGDPGTTTVDGRVGVSGLDATWATVIASAGNEFNATANPSAIISITTNGASSNHYGGNRRGVFLFDTSALTAAATVTAATFSLYGQAQSDISWAPDLNVYASSPASNTTLAGTDYANLGSTAFSTAITYAGFSTAGYNDFALNASGLAAVSKTGVTKLGVRNANYDVAAVAPTYGIGLTSTFAVYMADQAGTTNDPKLVVTYTLPASGNAIIGSD